MHSLTKHYRDFIGRCLSSGRYNNKSEVVRAGLRLLEAQEQAIKVETPAKTAKTTHDPERFPLVKSKQPAAKLGAKVAVTGDKAP